MEVTTESGVRGVHGAHGITYSACGWNSVTVESLVVGFSCYPRIQTHKHLPSHLTHQLSVTMNTEFNSAASFVAPSRSVGEYFLFFSFNSNFTFWCCAGQCLEWLVPQVMVLCIGRVTAYR